MNTTLAAKEITVGFHPEGYRIDKTASAMNRYTRWEVISEKQWVNPRPVCFDSLPQTGWMEADSFDWDDSSLNSEQ